MVSKTKTSFTTTKILFSFFMSQDSDPRFGPHLCRDSTYQILLNFVSPSILENSLVCKKYLILFGKTERRKEMPTWSTSRTELGPWGSVQCFSPTGSWIDSCPWSSLKSTNRLASPSEMETAIVFRVNPMNPENSSAKLYVGTLSKTSRATVIHKPPRKRSCRTFFKKEICTFVRATF